MSHVSEFQTSATYRALANALPLNLLIKSADGRRVFANDSYLKWRNVTWDELAGKRDDDLFPPEIAQKYRADDQQVMDTGEPLHSVESTRLGDNSIGWIERVKTAVHDHRGKLLGIQVLFWDVTAKVEKEKASQFEQSLLNTLLANIPDSIYFKDVDSRFIRVSQAMAQKFGLQSVEQVHGRTDADIFTPEHAEAARKDELTVIATGEALVDREERETWPDREDTWCMTTKMPLRNEEGDIIGTFGISRDITELKRSEAALREAVRMADAANRSKSEFLANMSHEIRTPMNALIGMADLLSQTELDADQQDYVQIIQESSNGLLRLINDILDFSKIEARRLELESVPFSLSKTVESTLRSFALPASEKGLELQSAIATELPDRLMGDPGRVRQVLTNLVGNAIKFTDNGGVRLEVDVLLREENPLDSNNGDQPSGKVGRPDLVTLRLSVRDSGIGIPPAQQDAVLNPFTQADASTTRRFGGTGLGLSISRQLVELMGGKLVLQSEVGVGTTFSFELRMPVCPESVPSEDDDEEEDLGGASHQRLAPLRVLVAEDGVTNQHVIAGLLRSLGHQCSIASDGRETLTKWRCEEYDVVLMDMHMPVMDGLEATRAIRLEELGTSRHTPIIALTAAAMSEDAAACRAAGMDSYLTKPIHSRKLREALTPYQKELPQSDDTSLAETIDQTPVDHLKLSDDQSSVTINAAHAAFPSAGSTSNAISFSSNTLGCLDLDSARSRIPGGTAGVLRLAFVFRTECEQLVSKLSDEMPAGLNDDARRTAHTLKGACGLLGAKQLQIAAERIEEAGRENRVAKAPQLLDDLKREAERVLAAVDELLSQSGSPDEA
ncbi:PAS domain-containing protein [Rhodopirellula sp. JC740]|uniref:histidine kinase n=1 Tax=Rhodopirellula halodulae TaxID=2894198 RepID=A0ABS8NFR2_9BACT|nr:PAS domain-containing hybrid sensor histidine kinase/response regulator [Rhodopirellula sp. JC740]MCC9642387.1 PAS domain-containing protein [Rhodopirellula sp. JC740]